MYKNWIKYLAVCAAFSVWAPGLLHAAEEAPAPASGEMRGRGDSGESRRGRRHGGMPPFMNDLREKYPAEMAEIEKLRESDPEAARTKMRELFSKAGFSGGHRMGPPGGMPPAAEPDEATLAKLKEKCPEEFAEYEKLKASDPEAARTKLRELLVKAGLAPAPQEATQEVKLIRDRHRAMLERAKKELKERYPERYAAIEAKWKTDPDGARRDFRALFAEAKIEIEAGQSSVEYDYAEEQKKDQKPNFGGNGGGQPGGFPPGPPPGMGGGR